MGGISMKKQEYQYYYEYINKNGRVVHCQVCTVYNSYKRCEDALCDKLDNLIRQGYTGVCGDIKEI